MINITITKDNALDIKIQGHAGYAQKGSDIICAAISVLYQSLVETFEEYRYFGDLRIIRSSDGFEHIRIYDISDNGMGSLRTFCMGCRSISEYYPNYVKFSY